MIHVEDYMHLVKKVAFKIKDQLPAHIEFDDLVGSGYIGLLEAQKTFDPKLGVPFEFYCQAQIKWSIYGFLRDMDPLKTHQREEVKTVLNHKQVLEEKLGRKPSDEEVAQSMGLSLFELNQKQSLGEVKLVDFKTNTLSSDDIDSFSPAKRLSNEDADICDFVLKKLRKDYQEILRLYFFEELDLKEIARAKKISQTAVKSLYSKALRAFRSYYQLEMSKPETYEQVV